VGPCLFVFMLGDWVTVICHFGNFEGILSLKRPKYKLWTWVQKIWKAQKWHFSWTKYDQIFLLIFYFAVEFCLQVEESVQGSHIWSLFSKPLQLNQHTHFNFHILWPQVVQIILENTHTLHYLQRLLNQKWYGKIYCSKSLILQVPEQ